MNKETTSSVCLCSRVRMNGKPEIAPCCARSANKTFEPIVLPHLGWLNPVLASRDWALVGDFLALRRIVEPTTIGTLSRHGRKNHVGFCSGCVQEISIKHERDTGFHTRRHFGCGSFFCVVSRHRILLEIYNIQCGSVCALAGIQSDKKPGATIRKGALTRPRPIGRHRARIKACAWADWNRGARRGFARSCSAPPCPFRRRRTARPRPAPCCAARPPG